MKRARPCRTGAARAKEMRAAYAAAWGDPLPRGLILYALCGDPACTVGKHLVPGLSGGRRKALGLPARGSVNA